MKPVRPRPSLHALALLVLILACLAAPVLAAEAEEKNPAEEPIGTVFRWLNFVLVFGGGGYLIARKAPAVFRARAEGVAASIAEASAAQTAAEQQLRETEEKLARLQQEVTKLRAAAQHESAAEAERIRALAHEEAEKIRRAAQLEAEAAEHAARIELKALAARLAVERADSLIRQKITAETRASLFRSFVDELAGSLN